MGSAGLFTNYPTEWWHWSYGYGALVLITQADSAIYGPALPPLDQRDLSRQLPTSLRIDHLHYPTLRLTSSFTLHATPLRRSSTLARVCLTITSARRKYPGL